MRGMRWLVALALAYLSMAVVGCKQQCFIHECDVTGPDYYKRLLLPEGIDCNAAAACQPGLANYVKEPSTVLNADLPIRYISLQEAIAIALEQGQVNQAPALIDSSVNETPGILAARMDSLINFTAFRGTSGITDNVADSIRVLALEPAMNGADIENALSRFDARWVTALNWNQVDNPTGSGLVSGTSFNQFNGMAADFGTGVVKPLPTGGIAGITFNTTYNLFATPTAGSFNPQYRPDLQFAFEQPLLQFFGVEINQIINQTPGSTNPALQQFLPGLTRLLFEGPAFGAAEGILVTRIRFDQSRADFERQIHTLVYNVEAAYWQLYGTYGTLFARNEGLRGTYETYKIFKARFEAGTLAPEDYYQTIGQFDLFRTQRLAALDAVQEAERELRRMLGLPMSDGHRLVPCDAPTLAPYHPDWDEALHEALALKPELVIAREELKTRQLAVIAAKNALLPDLRFTSNYDILGIGSSLDGPNGALHSLASNHFDNWRVGLELDVPIGFRQAHATLRIARLNLARGYHELRDQEYRVTSLLTSQYRQVLQDYEQIKINRGQREAYGQELLVLYRQRDAGKEVTQRLLEAERFFSDAVVSEYQSIEFYNIVLAGLEFAKGTILQHDNVVIGEGALPHCAQKRAVEHERERTAALVLRERENKLLPVAHAEAPGTHDAALLPGGSTAPALPALIKENQGLAPAPELAPEQAPAPRPAGPEQTPAPQQAPTTVEGTPATVEGPATTPPAGPAAAPTADVKLQDDQPQGDPLQPRGDINVDKPEQ
jgi:outer membrane protein TolC